MPHINKHLDFTVEVFVVFDGKVLLRKHDKYGIWLAVGGHIERDEDPSEAAIREVREEVGLTIELMDVREYKGDEKVTELVVPISVNRHRISETHEHVAFVYFAKAMSNRVVPEKLNDEWRWCAEEDVDRIPDLQSNIGFYAKKALRSVQ